MTRAREPHPYSGQRFALLTQHGKEDVFAPLFEDVLEARVEVVHGFDTDSLGTFTREVARAGSQLEAARRKAEKALELSGLPLALASEGAIGPDAYGLLPWDVELVLLIDRARGLEIQGWAQGPAAHAHARVASEEELEHFARAASFPTHALVVRPDDQDDKRIHKGLCDAASLRAAFTAALNEASTGTVFVETDLRAHMNPTRMEVIARAVSNLMTRIMCLCPKCRAPGYGVIERLPGLPCADCSTPTNEACGERFACVACAHQETRSLETSPWADPGRCPVCNP